MTSRYKSLDGDQKKIVEDYYDWMIGTVRRIWIRNWPDLEEEILAASDEGIVRAAFYFDRSKSIGFGRCCILQVNKYVKREIEREIRGRRFMRSLLWRVERLHRIMDHQRRP